MTRDLLSHLDGVRSVGRDQWMARCPAHDDRRQSLSLRLSDGKWLCKCHAGCETSDIVSAAGLTMSDLQPPRDTPPRPTVTHRPAAPTAPAGTTSGSDPVVYDYFDSSGRLVGRKTRFPDKRFSWDWRGEKPDHAPLYHADALARAEPGQRCYLVEGEKDCDRLISLGLLATTTPNGAAGKWHDDYTEALARLNVVILPDNDDPGRAYADRAAAALRAAGCDALTLALPGVVEKGDVSDWLEAGHDVAELAQLVTAERAKTGLCWDFRTWADQWSEDLLKRSRGEIKAIPTPWRALDNILGSGWEVGVHCLVGSTGAFKTQFALQCALKAARSGVPVLYLSTEMSGPMFLARVIGICCGWPWSSVFRGELAGLAVPEGYTDEGGLEPDEVLRIGLQVASDRLSGTKMSMLCKRPFSFTISELALLLAQAPAGAFVVIDYVGLLASDDPREDSRQRVTRAMGVLEAASSRQKLTILAVNATSRAHYESLDGKIKKGEEPPGCGDPRRFLAVAKESGDVEYFSTTLMVLMRAQPEENPDGVNWPYRACEMAIAKQRLGPESWCRLNYWYEQSIFRNGGGV